MLILLASSSLIILAGPSRARALNPLQPHTPIVIRSDTDFTTPNGVKSGNGTFLSPFIISDLNITAYGTDGIDISNTHDFFTISNVHVQQASPTRQNMGILFSNVQNGQVNSSSITRFNFGVQISAGSGNAIQNSNIWNNTYGMDLTGSGNLIAYNHLYNNTQYGALVESSRLNTFTKNYASDNGDSLNGAGFFITQASNNVFNNNTVRGNSWFGIKMIGSTFSASSSNLFSKNTISLNGGTPNGGGICRCDGGGLVFADNATGNTIVGNYVKGQDNGIGLEVDGYPPTGDFRNNITMNRVVGNNFGIYVINVSTQNIIYNNYFNNTTNVSDFNSPASVNGTTQQNSWNITKILRRNILGGPFTGGNFYSDYHQLDPDVDGIGDTPHSTGISSLDLLPLTLKQPTVVNDTAALRVTAQPSSARTGTNINITSLVANQGTVTESFNVTLSYIVCFPDP